MDTLQQMRNGLTKKHVDNLLRLVKFLERKRSFVERHLDMEWFQKTEQSGYPRERIFERRNEPLSGGQSHCRTTCCLVGFAAYIDKKNSHECDNYWDYMNVNFGKIRIFDYIFNGGWPNNVTWGIKRIWSLLDESITSKDLGITDNFRWPRPNTLVNSTEFISFMDNYEPNREQIIQFWKKMKFDKKDGYQLTEK